MKFYRFTKLIAGVKIEQRAIIGPVCVRRWNAADELE